MAFGRHIFVKARPLFPLAMQEVLETCWLTKTLISKSKEVPLLHFAWALYFTAAKFGAYWEICSIAFVISITDALEPCAALLSLTQLNTVVHLPASLNAFQLSPWTLIKTVDFFDGHATLPGFHLPEPQEISWLSWVDNPRLFGCPQINWGRTLKKALLSNWNKRKIEK
jgi:hypothetical protein